MKSHLLFYGILSWIGWQDGRTRKISNQSIAVLFLLSGFKFWMYGRSDWTEYVMGMLVISIPMLFITVVRPKAFGGGDIKLVAAGGFYLGMNQMVTAMIIAIMLAAFYCMFLILYKEKDKKTEIPLGPFLCLGMILT